MLAQNNRNASNFSLSSENKDDASEVCILLSNLQDFNEELKGINVVMDHAYEEVKPRKSAISMSFIPIFSPKLNRLNPWSYDKKCIESAIKTNI